MSAYSNFIQDFPRRCQEVLTDYEHQAILSGREVTLTFMVASSALIIPFERLNPSAHDHIADDRYDECVKMIGKLLNSPFQTWIPSNSCSFVASVPGQFIRLHDPEQWLVNYQTHTINGTTNVGFIFSHIRNALAHGNVFTYPSARSDKYQRPIEKILFLSRRYDSRIRKPLDEYNILESSPKDFLVLIKFWIGFLQSLPIPWQPTQSTFLEIPNYQNIVV